MVTTSVSLSLLMLVVIADWLWNQSDQPFRISSGRAQPVSCDSLFGKALKFACLPSPLCGTGVTVLTRLDPRLSRLVDGTCFMLNYLVGLASQAILMHNL